LSPLLTAILLLSPAVGQAQTLQDVAQALGAANLKSIEIQGSGVTYQVGQSQAPGMPWPQFNAKSFARLINYDTASLREEAVRIRALEPPRGGGPYARGEQRQVFMLNGDHTWNVVADAPVPVPITLADRQFQLWSTPHGVVKAALAGRGSMQGRTIAFAAPGRFKAMATVDASSLIERVDATLTNPVLGDMAVTISYAEYRDFGGVKFPTKIRQTYGGFPALDITVTDVRSNVAAEVQVPDSVRQAPNPYTRVTSQKVADGVFYLAGGTHHSVAIEMQDHVIVVEAPLNDERALAVLAEVRTLIPNKPIRYVVVSHQHFDHSGGVRAFAGEGITLVAHEVSKAFLERVITLPATVSPDHLAKSGKKAMVEGVRDKRVLSDGTRTIEIHHIAGVLHADDLLMVYLPKEKLLIEADHISPRDGQVRPGPRVDEFVPALDKLNLNVATIVGIHGDQATLAAAKAAAKK
jgi:glyoxylase-like metal-dependent hydrolase (beta-lactamase superfamily II)